MSDLKGIAGEIKIYTTPWCPYCIRAKKLLKKKGVRFQETDVSYDLETRGRLRDVTGSHTVPQIFISGRSVGGCDELYALDRAGQLDGLLAEVAGP